MWVSIKSIEKPVLFEGHRGNAPHTPRLDTAQNPPFEKFELIVGDYFMWEVDYALNSLLLELHGETTKNHSGLGPMALSGDLSLSQTMK